MVDDRCVWLEEDEWKWRRSSPGLLDFTAVRKNDSKSQEEPLVRGFPMIIRTVLCIIQTHTS